MARKIGESGQVTRSASVAGCAVYLLLAVAVYARAMHGTWLWDDRVDLPDNPVLKAAHPLRLIWSGQDTWDYYPIKNTLQWLQWNLWGERTFGYHLTNVLLHALSASLLWRLLRKLGLRDGWAWVGGLLFLVHPLAVGSVAWITEFKDTLSLPLLLLAADAYLGKAGRGQRTAIFWFVCAMLAKSSVMMFPLCILLYGWYAQRPWRRTVFSSLPYFAVSAVCGWIAVQLQHHRSIGLDGTGLGGPAFRLSLAGQAFAFYLRQALAPVQIAPVYVRWAVGGYVCWLIPAAILAVGFWRRATWGRVVVLGFGWFGFMLIPVLGLVSISYMRFSWVMDHLAYASLIGLAGLAAAGLQLLASRGGRLGRPSAIVLAVVAASVLALQSHAYVPAYASEEALWAYTVDHCPEQWMGYSNLGAVRENQGKVAEAVPLLEKAVRLNPAAPDAHRNLGIAYNVSGHPAEAIAEARRALELRPDYLLAVSDLGTYLSQAGRYAEAVPFWEQAVRLNPRDADLRNRYGFTLLLMDRREAGVAQIKQALLIDPSFGPAELNLALAFSQAGQAAAALPHFEAAARLMPNNAQVQQQLAQARKQR